VFGPALGYAAVLFAFSGTISSVHVSGGTFIHSAVGLAPHSYLLVIEGVFVLAARVGRRRSGWDPEHAGRLFAASAVVFGVIAAMVGTLIVDNNWNAKRERLIAVAAALDAAAVPATDRVMSVDASGTRYWTGRGGVVLVNDPITTVEKVATAYDIRWLVLERGELAAATVPILAGGPLPGWLGPPILNLPEVKVYPVCTTGGDPRCAVAGVTPATGVEP
jgi:hypothetical protein